MKTKVQNLMGKLKTYYSYNKYKLPIIFALISMVFLTAFPGLHYKYWYEKPSKYNAISVFIIMIISALQLVNAINLSAKKDKKTEKIFTVLFTIFTLLTIFFAYLYISPYFLNPPFKMVYLSSIIVIIIGIIFMITANVFAFIFYGYDTKANLKRIIAELEESSNE